MVMRIASTPSVNASSRPLVMRTGYTLLLFASSSENGVGASQLTSDDCEFRVPVVDVYALDEAQVNVVFLLAHADSDRKLFARISRRALERLGFSAGQKIFAQVKVSL
ncbi:MAG: hypothetical protein EHM23_00400 [Acidobacteria bacterium]|nr:MAG: hypothetical protein EHM23_00400 [Acidobacteriota bacterium]